MFGIKDFQILLGRLKNHVTNHEKKKLEYCIATEGSYYVTLKGKGLCFRSASYYFFKEWLFLALRSHTKTGNIPKDFQRRRFKFF